jgi:hypothetical protein
MKKKKATTGTYKSLALESALKDNSTEDRFCLEINIPLPSSWYGWFKDNNIVAEYNATRGVTTLLEAPRTPQTEECINHLKMLLHEYNTSSIFPGKVWAASSVPTKYHPPATTTNDVLPF